MQARYEAELPPSVSVEWPTICFTSSPERMHTFRLPPSSSHLRSPAAICNLSYCAVLVAIVSQNSFVLVFFFGGGGITELSDHYCAICCKMGYCTDVRVQN